MTKIVVPKHVEAGLFDMGVDIGPVRVKMWQLFVIAVGGALAFSIVNGLKKRGLGTVAGLIIASPVILLTFLIAFFRKSELYIVPFLVKIIRTYVLASPKVFDKNTIRPADYEIKIEYSKLNKGEEKKIEQKELNKDELEKDLDILSKW